MSAVCCHFGTCGGCSYQNLPDAEYRALKHALVVDALSRHGFRQAEVEDVVEVAPATRRRAVFKAAKKAGEVEIGFHAAKSHAIADMHECLVLTPALTALVAQLRETMQSILRDGEDAELHVTDTDVGFDIALRWKRGRSSKTISELARIARPLNVARFTAGGEPLVERARPSVSFGKAEVALPPDSFLQPTQEGEAILQDRVISAMKGRKDIVDLFSGCGTFTLPLAERMRVQAVDSDGSALASLQAAARRTPGLKPVTVNRRDLFKRPLVTAELNRFDAIVLDPPRAGAASQCGEIAKSRIERIAYVSCNPESFARDARILADAGFSMTPVLPVDQFLWSSHIELFASFART